MTFITIQLIFTGLLYIKSSLLFSTEISCFTQKYITKENWLQTVYFVFGVIVVDPIVGEKPISHQKKRTSACECVFNTCS